MSRPRRVLLWDYEPRAEFVAALAAAGVEVVACCDGGLPGLPHYPMDALVFGAEGLPPLAEPASGLRPDAGFHQLFARCAARIGRVPFSGRLEVMYGDLLGPADLHDWAQLLIRRAAGILDHHRVDEVWFCSIPHLGMDQAMHAAAVARGRRVLWLRQLTVPAKFQYCAWIDGRKVTPTVEGFRAWTAGVQPLSLFYMQPRQWAPPSAAWRSRAAALWRGLRDFELAPLLARLWQGATDREWHWLVALLEYADPRTRGIAGRRGVARRDWRRDRARLQFHQLAELGAPYVYFPMHYQPEANNEVYGGVWHNQADVVETLHEALPPGWLLVLKEHTIQRHARRSPAFHARIASLPKVRWVAEDTPGSELLARCALPVTITGTVGWEALCAGRSCVHFGDPWYAGLPGVIPWSDDLDLEAIAAARPDRVALNSAANRLFTAAADGLVARRFVPALPADIDDITAARLAAASLVRISAALDRL